MKFSKLVFNILFIIFLVSSLNVNATSQQSTSFTEQSKTTPQIISDITSVSSIQSLISNPSFSDFFLPDNINNIKNGLVFNERICPATTPFSSELTLHDEIEISSDEELASNSTSGSGTAEDPYVIELLNITVSSYYEGLTGIRISDTTQHFVIRNCYIDTANRDQNTGISISNVSPGTANITNNIVTNNNFGIVVTDSSSSVIVNNTLYSNRAFGIIVGDSSSSSVTNNDFIGDGFIVYESLLERYLSYEIEDNLVNGR